MDTLTEQAVRFCIAIADARDGINGQPADYSEIAEIAAAHFGLTSAAVIDAWAYVEDMIASSTIEKGVI